MLQFFQAIALAVVAATACVIAQNSIDPIETHFAQYIAAGYEQAVFVEESEETYRLKGLKESLKERMALSKKSKTSSTIKTDFEYVYDQSKQENVLVFRSRNIKANYELAWQLATEEIDRLLSTPKVKWVTPTISLDPPRVGLFGLANEYVEVTQIVGESEFHGYCKDFNSSSGEHSVIAKQVWRQLAAGRTKPLDAGEKTAINAIHDCNQRLLFRGVPATQLAEKQVVHFNQILKITKTENYTTVSNIQNTVFVVEPVQTSVLSQLKSYVDANVPPNHQKPTVPPRPPRTWTSMDGKFSTIATFISASENEVTIEKSDGKRVTLELSKLLIDDRKWIEANKIASSILASGLPQIE